MEPLLGGSWGQKKLENKASKPVLLGKVCDKDLCGSPREAPTGSIPALVEGIDVMQ
jgi:hypothetical protein